MGFVGSIQGRETDTSREFLGIPYADQVSIIYGTAVYIIIIKAFLLVQGPRWFSPTARLTKYATNPMDATKFGACCPQVDVGLYIPYTVC